MTTSRELCQQIEAALKGVTEGSWQWLASHKKTRRIAVECGPLPVPDPDVPSPNMSAEEWHDYCEYATAEQMQRSHDRNVEALAIFEWAEAAHVLLPNVLVELQHLTERNERLETALRDIAGWSYGGNEQPPQANWYRIHYLAEGLTRRVLDSEEQPYE